MIISYGLSNMSQKSLDSRHLAKHDSKVGILMKIAVLIDFFISRAEMAVMTFRYSYSKFSFILPELNFNIILQNQITFLGIRASHFLIT